MSQSRGERASARAERGLTGRSFLCEPRPAREVVLPSPLQGLPASLVRAATAR
jgi:hypothetical protein